MSKLIKLTNTEQSLLRQLKNNSRTPLSQISKKIRRSQQLTSYALHSLQQKEVIKGFYSLIDYSKLNVLHFRVYFKINYGKRKEFSVFISSLKSLTSTSWISTCGGDFDLICTFFAPNPSWFNKQLKEIMSKNPDSIRDYTVLTTILIRKNYSTYKDIIIGGDRTPEQLELLDLNILSALATSARISSAEIAHKHKVNAKTIISRIKKLEKNKVLRMYQPLLDYTKLDISTTKLLIRFHNIDINLEEEMLRYLKKHDEITSVTKTIGEWDLEINTITKTMQQVREIIIELTDTFAKIIQDVRYIPLYDTHKLSYFPEFLLDY